MSEESIAITPALHQLIINRGDDWITQENIHTIEMAISLYAAQYRAARKEDRKDAIDQILKLIDDIIKDFPPRDKIQLSCKRGCSFCCHQNVDITEDEALLIADYCNKNNIPISKSYLQAQLKWNNMEVSISPQSACVFLKNSECSIYEARPIQCRKYMVASPAEKCNIATHPPPHNKVAVFIDWNLEILVCGMASVIENHNDRLPKMLLPYSK